MSEINGEKAAVPVHSKRLGRELAMEFLFSCELQNEFPGAEKFGQFLEAVQDEFMLGDNRQSHRAVWSCKSSRRT